MGRINANGQFLELVFGPLKCSCRHAEHQATVFSFEPKRLCGFKSRFKKTVYRHTRQAYLGLAGNHSDPGTHAADLEHGRFVAHRPLTSRHAEHQATLFSSYYGTSTKARPPKGLPRRSPLNSPSAKSV